VDPYLAIASKRDERSYADAPVSPRVRERILDAGRLTGSSKNRQRWEFVVVSGEARDRLAEAVYAPENVASAGLVVAIVGEAGGFDCGRCAQNMMLAAWGEGVASCPNGVRDADAAAEPAAGRYGRFSPSATRRGRATRRAGARKSGRRRPTASRCPSSSAKSASRRARRPVTGTARSGHYFITVVSQPIWLNAGHCAWRPRPKTAWAAPVVTVS
jgi:hypothetical protein